MRTISEETKDLTFGLLRLFASFSFKPINLDHFKI